MDEKKLRDQVEKLARKTDSVLAILILVDDDDHFTVSVSSTKEKLKAAPAALLTAITRLLNNATMDTINRIPF